TVLLEPLTNARTDSVVEAGQVILRILPRQPSPLAVVGVERVATARDSFVLTDDLVEHLPLVTFERTVHVGQRATDAFLRLRRRQSGRGAALEFTRCEHGHLVPRYFLFRGTGICL